MPFKINPFTGRLDYFSESSFSQSEIDELKELVFDEFQISNDADVSYFEKGVETDINFSYDVTPNDDTVTSIVYDGVSQPVSQLTHSILKAAKTATQSITINVNVEDVAYNSTLQKTSTETVPAYVPQFAGASSNENITSSDELSYAGASALTKYVQSSDNIDHEFTLADEYAYFVSAKNNAEIYDQNDFQQSVGTWGDNVSEFYVKEITLTLADGSTETMYLYRTRTLKNTTMTYKIR